MRDDKRGHTPHMVPNLPLNCLFGRYQNLRPPKAAKEILEFKALVSLKILTRLAPVNMKTVRTVSSTLVHPQQAVWPLSMRARSGK